MENFNTIKKLLKNANAITELFKVKIPKWEMDKKYYDKTHYCFNYDDRYSATEPIQIYFSSKMGVYGDSSCTRQLSIDKDVFEKHLVEYLNSNRHAIMIDIANRITKEAEGLKDKAKSELDAQFALLQEIENI